MKILIATPIYPPQVGGPATYSAALYEALTAQGHDVIVGTFGSLSQLPSGLRHLAFFLKLLACSLDRDAILSFDTYSAGLPAVVVHCITRKPLVVRVGGDFVWELYIERTGDLVPLSEIYTHTERWSRKEQFVFRVVNFVMRRATLAFSSQWQREIWRTPYALNMSRTTVIENAIEEKRAPHEPTRKNFLFYTRPIKLKNHAAFRRAFASAKEKHPEIELEEGKVSHEELMERMRSCYAVVLPSITDITPNYIVDAIRCGKPFLVTKHSGLSPALMSLGVVVDPLSEADMARGIEQLCDPARYAETQTKIRAFNQVRTYADIAREFVALLH